MFGENIRLRSINAERTRCLNYCRQTNRCRNDARLLTRAMWILNWRYGFHARSSLLQLAAFPRGGLTPAEAPLIDAEILFRQPQPPNGITWSGWLAYKFLDALADGPGWDDLSSIVWLSLTVSISGPILIGIRSSRTDRGRDMDDPDLEPEP